MTPIFAVACLLLQDAGDAPAAPDLAWLEGVWRFEQDGVISEERWTGFEDGMALGVNRTNTGGRTVAFEFLRIETTPSAIRYCAQPGGRVAVCFDLVAAEARSIRFENPGHDFPQRIEYTREGDTLTAEISSMDRGQTMEFQWRRVGD